MHLALLKEQSVPQGERDSYAFGPVSGRRFLRVRIRPAHATAAIDAAETAATGTVGNDSASDCWSVVSSEADGPGEGEGEGEGVAGTSMDVNGAIRGELSVLFSKTMYGVSPTPSRLASVPL